MAAAAREGSAGGSLRGLRVGVVKQLMLDGVQPGVKARFEESLALLAAQGAEIVEIDAPHFEYAVAAYYLILPAEASSNLAKYDSVRFGLRVNPEGAGTVENVMSASREVGFGAEVKRRIILGTYALSAGYYDAYYGSAQKVRTLIQRDFAQAFAQVDVIASPTAPTVSYTHLDVYKRQVFDESGVFERLSLEAFQSGLSWLTILRKREAFRDAFANFDICLLYTSRCV